MITQGPERNKRRNWSWMPGRTWWVHRDPFQETFSQLQLRTVFNIMTLKLKKICRCEIMSCVASFTEMHMLYHYKYLQRWNNICFCHITTHQTVSISQLRPFYYCCHYDEGHLTFSLPSFQTYKYMKGKELQRLYFRNGPEEQQAFIFSGWWAVGQMGFLSSGTFFGLLRH